MSEEPLIPEEPEESDEPRLADSVAPEVVAEFEFEPAAVSRVQIEVPEGFQQLDPNWIPCERIGSRIFMLILGLGSAASILVFAWLDIIEESSLLWWIAGWLVGIPFLAWLGFRWPVWEFPFRGWELDEESFYVKKGLITRHNIRVPRSRVQYTDVVQGPVQRRFGLATLQVHVAGTESATVALEGVRHEIALRLRDILIEGGGDDAV